VVAAVGAAMALVAEDAEAKQHLNGHWIPSCADVVRVAHSCAPSVGGWRESWTPRRT
jgi:hypothetical protein